MAIGVLASTAAPHTIPSPRLLLTKELRAGKRCASIGVVQLPVSQVIFVGVITHHVAQPAPQHS
jgi:hypothetical protein